LFREHFPFNQSHERVIRRRAATIVQRAVGFNPRTLDWIFNSSRSDDSTPREKNRRRATAGLPFQLPWVETHGSPNTASPMRRNPKRRLFCGYGEVLKIHFLTANEHE
jgi:hypothetical protein